MAVPLVSVVVVVAVPPPLGTVTVRVFWLAPKVSVGAAETLERLRVRAVVARARSIKTLSPGS